MVRGEVVSTFVRKTYFIFIHDTELNRSLLWFTSFFETTVFIWMHTQAGWCTLSFFLSRLHMCLGNEIWKKTKKKQVKIVYLAMPASMSHCFVILFCTQTTFNRELCTEKPVNVSKTVPYLWWKSCRSKNIPKAGKLWNGRIVINKYLSES